MYLACSSESYNAVLSDGRLTLADWFRVCRELQLTAVELEDKHVGDLGPGHLSDVKAAAARYGLSIVNIALMNNFGLADDARRRAEETRTVEWMGISRHLGTRFLRTFAGWPEGDRQARWPQMIASLKAVAGEATRAGVRLVMENHNHAGFVQTADDVLAILDGVRSPALGLLLDTGNYLDGLTSITRTAKLAWHVHAKFTRVLPDGRDARVDHDAALKALRDAGYDGCISIEYEGEEPGSTAVPRAVRYLRKAIEG